MPPFLPGSTATGRCMISIVICVSQTAVTLINAELQIERDTTSLKNISGNLV